MKSFDLQEPATVDEAVSALHEFGDSAKLYAGGTELLLAMKSGLLEYETLVNVKSVVDLADISLDGTSLRIGASATHSTIEHSRVVNEHFPLIADVEHRIANVRVRNVGTLVGNLCFAEPHSDPGALLLLYEAKVTVISPSGMRTISIEELVTGPYETSLATDEFVTHITVPALPDGMKGAYMKFGYHHRPTLGIGAAVVVNNGMLDDVRLTLGSVSPSPLRLYDAEAALCGSAVNHVGAVAEAGALAATVCEAIDDLHGTAEYKRHLVEVFVARAVSAAVNDGVR